MYICYFNKTIYCHFTNFPEININYWYEHKFRIKKCIIYMISTVCFSLFLPFFLGINRCNHICHCHFKLIGTRLYYSRNNDTCPVNTEWTSKLCVKITLNMKFKKELLMLFPYSNWLKSIGESINFSWYRFQFCFSYSTLYIGLPSFYKI